MKKIAMCVLAVGLASAPSFANTCFKKKLQQSREMENALVGDNERKTETTVIEIGSVNDNSNNNLPENKDGTELLLETSETEKLQETCRKLKAKIIHKDCSKNEEGLSSSDAKPIVKCINNEEEAAKRQSWLTVLVLTENKCESHEDDFSARKYAIDEYLKEHKDDDMVVNSRSGETFLSAAFGNDFNILTHIEKKEEEEKKEADEQDNDVSLLETMIKNDIVTPDTIFKKDITVSQFIEKDTKESSMQLCKTMQANGMLKDFDCNTRHAKVSFEKAISSVQNGKNYKDVTFFLLQNENNRKEINKIGKNGGFAHVLLQKSTNGTFTKQDGDIIDTLIENKKFDWDVRVNKQNAFIASMHSKVIELGDIYKRYKTEYTTPDLKLLKRLAQERVFEKRHICIHSVEEITKKLQDDKLLEYLTSKGVQLW